MTAEVHYLKQILSRNLKSAFLRVIHCAYIAPTLAFVVNPIQSFPTNTVVRARFVFALHGFILALKGEQQTLVDICDKHIIAFDLAHKSETALHAHSHQDKGTVF